MKPIFILLVIAAAARIVQGQEPNWDVANPPGEWNYHTHAFTTDEGTWMNLDVSPDGSTIVFDMLGDLYSIPVEGGEATLLRGGLPFEIQPRYSPDGSHILFTSDAGGGDNIWVMKPDGSEARQVTHEDFRLLNNATWMPDGQFFVARKHFTSQRSLGAGELWMYHINGGTGVQLTKRKNDQQDVNEPCVSPDGRYLYFSEDMYPGGYFQYNKDPNSEIYVIFRYDFETGEITKITGGPGGACRPQVSPDGKSLAFVKRVRTKSVLYVRDLESGSERPVYDGLDKDQQEAWAIFGVYPNYSWLPDSRSLIIWADGRFKKVNTQTLLVEEVPFTVNAEVKIAEALRFKHEVAPETFSAKMIRHAITSPDGKHLVFSAVGYLWKKELPHGRPQRLTADADFEFEPAFSPDGKHIVYVTWNDETLGTVRRVPLKGGASTVLTQEKGIFRHPNYAPDAKRIVVQKEGGNNDQGHRWSVKPGIYLLPATGGDLQLVTTEGASPRFSADGHRIFYQSGGNWFGAITKELKSVNLSGGDKRTHATSNHANRIVPSPDNQWVAFIQLHKVYAAPLPMTGQPIDLDGQGKNIPVALLSKDAGVNLHWASDSKSVCYTLGQRYFKVPLNERFRFLSGAPDTIPPLDSVGLAIGLRLPADKPEGTVAFTNARIITMRSDEVIERGTVIVDGNRIAAVGAAAEVSVPRGAFIIDAEGLTIMPGIIDVHAHLGVFREGLNTQQHWPFYANLAYGVTTAHDPSAHTETVFALSELQRTGAVVGPRIFSTGFILYGADGDFKAVINNFNDASSAIRRTSAFGAHSVKSYNQPRRNQRQQVIRAAREQGIHVVPEGGSTFYHNMTMIFDGHTGVEHNIPIAPAYRDVIELWSHSKTGYTPTLIVNYGGLNSEVYWYQHSNVWEDEKLLTFMPRAVIDARARHRTMAPLEEYENGHILTSKTCKKLSDAGVKVNLGAHGQLQGLGAHWELWSLAQGGMTPLESIRAATLNGAHYLGLDDDIGSLEPGKLADLIVLDKNPLDDIHNSNSVKYTMINGRLYDSATMNELGNHPRERSKFYWEAEGYDPSFDWHLRGKGFFGGLCRCQ